MAKKIPEIPAASLADIAFMLLIFFLVTTTMDVDSGLERRLPPFIEEIDQDTPPIKERNVFIVLVNRENQLLVEGEWMQLGELRERTKEFMANPFDREDLPEKEFKEVEFFGEMAISKGVISLQNDLGTQYGMYIAVQNELVGAINELREELSRAQFGKPYASLTREEQSAVREVFPQRISEAEPKKVGGN